MGDINILTPMAKYSFKSVSFAYDWVDALLDYIDAHRNEDVFVDMEQLLKCGEDDFCYFGHSVTVECIK